jgi:hypothetical protein
VRILPLIDKQSDIIWILFIILITEIGYTVSLEYYLTLEIIIIITIYQDDRFAVKSCSFIRINSILVDPKKCGK